MPVDLFSEDDADETVLTKAHKAWNAKLEARIRVLDRPGDRDLLFALLALRDLINDS